MKNLYLRAVGGGASLASLFAAFPARADEVAPVLNGGDTAWVLMSSVLVLMMTLPGLILFYGGMVRKKNVLSVCAEIFAVACLASLIWPVAGYSLAFTEGNAFLGGWDRLMLSGVTVTALKGTIPESVFVIFQMTFIIITAALITGALVERMKFSAMLVFMVLWMLIVYIPVAHWVWGPGGFLANDGVLDYAGGTVVHINAGVAGLVACLVLGPRVGFGTDNMSPHNLVLSVTGACLLWVGWFGFNGGSALAADGRAGMAMLVTQIAAAASALSWMFTEWTLRGKPSVLGMISGAVGGLVAITPASGFVGPVAALVIGLVAGVSCCWGATWLKHKLGYDDSLDAFGVHGIGGIVGALLTGVFAQAAIGGVPGLIEGNALQVWIQFKGIVVTIVWSGVISLILMKGIAWTMGFRVPVEKEREGLDIAEHGESIS